MAGKQLFWIAGGLGVVALLAALAYAVSVFAAGKADRTVFSPEWETCDGGDVCVAVPAPCGEWKPVNKTHERDAAAYYDHLTTVVETNGMVCMGTDLSVRRPSAYCLSGACALAR